jgi:hypothetical protein
MKTNRTTAQYSQSHKDSLTDIQKAACQIIPQGVSIALSIREMIRQGYLLSARILIRPLIERYALIAYLHKNPNDVKIWNNGWNYRERPTFHKMLESVMNGDSADIICKVHNSLVHGDPQCAYNNIIMLKEEEIGYASSKIINNPKLADITAAEVQIYLLLLKNMMEVIFPPDT